MRSIFHRFEVNSARLRARKLSKEPNMPIDLSQTKYDLRIEVPEAHNDEFTTVCRAECICVFTDAN